MSQGETDDIFGEFDIDEDYMVKSKEVLGLFVAQRRRRRRRRRHLNPRPPPRRRTRETPRRRRRRRRRPPSKLGLTHLLFLRNKKKLRAARPMPRDTPSSTNIPQFWPNDGW